MNLLLTSVGRRRYLIEYFIESAPPGSQVHIANSDPECPAFSLNIPKIVTPPIYSDTYLPFLKKYCERHNIGAIISLFDADLPVLARAKEMFSVVGIKIIVADEKSVSICNDKWHTFQALRRQGIGVPRTFLTLEGALRDCAEITEFIVKPRWGMGSIGLRTVTADQDALQLEYNEVQRAVFETYLRYESEGEKDSCVLIQEKLQGIEYGLDVINDLNGNYVTTCIKRKLGMRAGETDGSITESIPALVSLGEKLGRWLKHPGNLDVDVFVTEHGPCVLELNARFGGGYPFSHLAGINLPAAIWAWLEDKEAAPSCFEWKAGVKGFKDIIPRKFSEHE